MNKKIVVIAGIVVVLIAGLVFWSRHKSNKMRYVTVPVTRGTLTSTVEETGTLNPIGNTTVTTSGTSATVSGGVVVGAQVTGRIMAIYVNFNSHVRKGQLLAQIDPLPYQATVDQDKAQLNNSEASLTQARIGVSSSGAQLLQDQAAHQSTIAQKQRDQATLQNDLINYHREEVLVKQDFDSRQNLDNAHYAYEAQKSATLADEAQIQQAAARVRSSRAGLRIAKEQVVVAGTVIDRDKAKLSEDEANLSYTRIVSPVDGIVIAKNIDLGQTVVSSFQSPSLFVLAKDLKKMQIDTLVDEADITKIRIGQDVDFNVDALPSQTFHGKVSAIRINPINQQNVVDYDVIVIFDNAKEKLFPGMQADAKFMVARRENVLEIPNQALRFVPPVEKQGMAGAQTPLKKYVPHVWVLQAGKPTRRDVQTGFASDSETEILSGLQEGEKVITDVQTGPKSTRTLLF